MDYTYLTNIYRHTFTKKEKEKEKETRAKYVQHHTVQTRFPIKDQILFIIAAGILFVLQLMFGMVRIIFYSIYVKVE